MIAKMIANLGLADKVVEVFLKVSLSLAIITK